MDNIELRSFTVEKKMYGEDEGLYVCKARFSTKGMDFTIALDPSLGELLVAACKGVIADASQHALIHLTTMAKGEAQDAGS